MGDISNKVQESSKNSADMHCIEKRKMMCRYITGVIDLLLPEEELALPVAE